MRPLRIGIVGCGAIGSHLARVITEDFSGRANLVSIYDLDSDKTERLAAELGGRIIVEKSAIHLVKRVELVVEAASASVSYEVAKNALTFRKDVMIMSVGGLMDRADVLFELAERNNCRIFIPSGAICGIDGIKAAGRAGIRTVRLTTYKSAETFRDVPYVQENNISLDNLRKEKVIFEGSAGEAVKYFPRNVNVAATLSLAGIGAENTRVRIIATPAQKTNVHEIEIEGEAGRIFVRTENKTHPDNPKTSYLAVLSAIETLRGITESVRIGT